MAKAIKSAWLFIFTYMKEILAFLVVFTWCVSIFLPESLVDEVTQRSFERILLMIVGFYFGAHQKKPHTMESEKGE
jgi:hypothetical protein